MFISYSSLLKNMCLSDPYRKQKKNIATTLQDNATCFSAIPTEPAYNAVSYTHLDVYKRQSLRSVLSAVLPKFTRQIT